MSIDFGVFDAEIPFGMVYNPFSVLPDRLAGVSGRMFAPALTREGGRQLSRGLCVRSSYDMGLRRLRSGRQGRAVTWVSCHRLAVPVVRRLWGQGRSRETRPCCCMMGVSGIGVCQRSVAARPGSTAGGGSWGPCHGQAPGAGLGPPPTDPCSPQKPGRRRPCAGEGTESGDLGQRPRENGGGSEPSSREAWPCAVGGGGPAVSAWLALSWLLSDSLGPLAVRGAVNMALGNASRVARLSTCRFPMSAQAGGVT